MRKTLLLLSFIATLSSSAQKIEKYFNYKWERCAPADARYYALIEFKDSLWSRHDYFIHAKTLQMQGSYRDSACKIPEGTFYYFHANGRLSSTGGYAKGKKQGIWLGYHSNGMMSDSSFYINGRLADVSMSWHRNGYPSDSAMYNGNRSVHVSWFDNGNLSAAGYRLNDSLQGKWVFYHRNGNISARETYNQGKLVNREYYDENGQPVTDTTSHDGPAAFGGGPKAWTRYMLSKLYFPTQYKLTGGDKAIVIVAAAIDEEGNITEIEVTTPFHRDFDDIAVKMMKGSPKWKPAMSHNRKVKYYFRQPVAFAQSE